MSQPPDRSKPHHRPAGFQNNYIDFVPKSLAEALRWKWNAARNGLPKPPVAPIPSVEPRLDFLARSEERRVGKEC